MIYAELSLPELSILKRHEFISTLQTLLKSPEAKEYTPSNYYWHTQIDDLLSVYSLHIEILTEEDEDDAQADSEDSLSAKDELFEFWEASELAHPFQEKIKSLPLLESSEFVLALFEQNLLGFFYIQVSKSSALIDSLIYPITMDVGDSAKQIYVISRDQLISFETPSETFPVIVIKDFLSTVNKVSYLDKGKWSSADITPSGYHFTEAAPIKIIHQGQLNSAQYTEAVTRITNALKLIRNADESFFNFVCVFTTHLCVTSDPLIAANSANPVPGMSFICLDKASNVELAVRILQSSALHFLNATLVLNDFIIDDDEDSYFDVEANSACSILDIFRNVQISYWPLVFLLKTFDTAVSSKSSEYDLERLLVLALELNVSALIYEDYIEHAFQTYKITKGGKDFCEEFIKNIRDLSAKVVMLENFIQKKFPDDFKKLQHKLGNWQNIKKKHSLNH